jgi:hypothetical protein
MAKTANLARLVSIIIFSMFSVTASFSQTSFYVDPSFSGGSRNGSASAPWQSLSDSGAWSAVNAALASANVTVFFSATGASTSAVGLGNRTNTSSHVLTLDGISQKNTNSSSPSWTTNVTPTPCKYDAPGCNWASAPKFVLTATTPFEGTDQPGNCVGNFTIQGFTIHNTEGQTADLAYIHDLIFQYNDASRTATGSYGPGIIAGPGNGGPGCGGTGPNNVTIQFNHIHATWGECIYIGASTPDPPGGTTSCGTACHTGDNYLIEGNVIESCASWGGQGDGTDIKDGHTNLRVMNNTYRTSKPCSNCGTQTPGNDGQGILFESGSQAIGNYIEAPGHQCMPIYASWANSVGRGDMLISNNMCVNAKSGSGSNVAYHVWGASVSQLWSTVEMYNNTAYLTGEACMAADSGSTTGGTTMKNNVCHSTAGGVSGSATHDYNDYYNTGSCPSETHGICSDPLFISTANPYVDANFKLQSGSPIGTAGMDLSASFSTDYFGNTRTMPWSMSAAAEATSLGPTPPSGLIATVN